MSIATALRNRRPLVQCLTNYVAMDLSANLLNAVGASPAMVHDAREAGEFAGVADSVLVNIGTLSPPWVEGMLAAVDVARARGIPWVLDPVAVGATAYRRETALQLLQYGPAVVRRNASEVVALAGAAAAGRGVDSGDDPGAARSHAIELAARLGCVVAVTGPVDLVTDGEREAHVRGGDDRLPLITATGCALSALVAASCAALDDPLVGTVGALALLTAAAERAGREAAGPGSLRWRLLDALPAVSDDELAEVLGRG